MLTAGFNLLLRSNLDADANRVLQARASAALEGISVQGGSCSVKESPDRAAPDTQVWVYSGDTAVERPPAPPSVQRLADSLAGGPKAHAEDPTSDIRLFAVPIVAGGRARRDGRLGDLAGAVRALRLEGARARRCSTPAPPCCWSWSRPGSW